MGTFNWYYPLETEIHLNVMKNLFFVCVLVSIFFTQCRAQDIPVAEIKNSNLNSLEKIKFYIDNRFLNIHKGIDYQDSLGVLFEQSMKELAKQELQSLSLPAFKRTGVSEKIYEIARYHSDSSALFDEIRSRYVESVHNRQSVFPRSPALLEKHMEPRYKLVWEYFLLRPLAKETAGLFTHRVTEALASIGQEDTSVLLGEMLSISSNYKGRAISTVGEKQRLYINTLSRIPSEKSLNFIIDFLESSEEQNKKRKDDLIYNPEIYIPKIFSKNLNPDLNSKWKDIFQSVPLNKFDSKQLKIFNDLKNSF